MEKIQQNYRGTRKRYIRGGRWWCCLDLAELGLEGGVDLIKGAAKSCELFPSLIGDQKPRHPFPVYGSRRLQCHIGNFLSRSAHFPGKPLFSSDRMCCQMPNRSR